VKHFPKEIQVKHFSDCFFDIYCLHHSASAAASDAATPQPASVSDSHAWCERYPSADRESKHIGHGRLHVCVTIITLAIFNITLLTSATYQKHLPRMFALVPEAQ
jgi:hypothetical protein